MSRDKIFQSLWAALIAFCLTFGSLGCMATGLELLAGKELATLALWCGAWALALSGLNLLRFAPWSVLLIGLGLAWGWFYGPLDESVERLVYEVSTVYHQGYGWNVLYWTSHPTAGSLMPAMRAIALVVLLPICSCVTRRGSVWSAMPLALLPLGSTMLLMDTVPQSGYLLLYLFGVLVLLLTQGVRRRSTSQGNALTLHIAPPVALVLGLIFLLNPQSGYNKQHLAEKLDKGFNAIIEHFTQPETQDHPDATLPDVHIPTVGDTGSAVDLEALGPKSRQTQVVMTVVSGQSGRIYLRGASYADYDGKTWNRGSQNDRASQWPTFSDNAPRQTLVITTKKEHSVLYLPYYTPRLQDMQQGRVINSADETTYQLSYCRVSTDTLKQPAAQEVSESYTDLPAQTRLWAEEKVQAILGGEIAPQEAAEVVYAAQTIGQFVAGSAKYSLDTPRMPDGEDDFARWFLESSDTGYCTHFATAAVVLLRSANIPARYVSGYSVNAKAEKSVNVILGDAHAWVEYYVPGVGWMVLDPTPGNQADPQQPPVQTRPPETTPRPTTGPETSNPQATTPPGETLPGQTSDPDATTSGDSQGMDGPTKPVTDKELVDLRWLKYILWPLAVVGVVLLQWRLRVGLRRQNLTSDRGNRRAMQYWREAERLAKLVGEDVPKPVQELAQKAKFSQHTLTKEELQQMRSYLTGCEKRLRRYPWYRQVLYTLVYALY